MELNTGSAMGCRSVHVSRKLCIVALLWICLLLGMLSIPQSVMDRCSRNCSCIGSRSDLVCMGTSETAPESTLEQHTSSSTSGE